MQNGLVPELKNVVDVALGRAKSKMLGIFSSLGQGAQENRAELPYATMLLTRSKGIKQKSKY